MKRQILHLGCFNKTPAFTETSKPFDVFQGMLEKTHVVFGRLKHHCLCDLCGGEIKIKERAVAESISAVGRNDYYPWEEEYIEKDVYF